MDYGRKYFYRHEIFLPVNIIYIIGFLVLSGVLLFILRYDLTSYSKTEIKKLLVSSISDASLFCLMSFHFIFLAGAINDEFKVHIGCIERNRLLVHSLLAQRGFYFRALHLAPASRLQADTNTLVDRSESFVREKLVAETLALLPPDADDVEATVVEELETVVGVYDEVLAGLQHDEEHNHVRILGFGVSRMGAGNTLVALISVVFTVYQLILS